MVSFRKGPSVEVGTTLCVVSADKLVPCEFSLRGTAVAVHQGPRQNVRIPTAAQGGPEEVTAETPPPTSTANAENL